MKKIIAIVSLNTLFAEGIKRILEVANYSYKPNCYNIESELVQLEAKHIDLMIVDIDGVSNPINTIEVIKAKNPSKILVLSSNVRKDLVKKLVFVGIDGYLQKTTSSDIFFEAIRYIENGYIYYDQRIVNIVYSEYKRLSNITEEHQPIDLSNEKNYVLDILTNREVLVLQLLTEGCSNRDISKRLMISEKTVKNYITNILTKLKVRDRTNAAVKALRLQITS